MEQAPSAAAEAPGEPSRRTWVRGLAGSLAALSAGAFAGAGAGCQASPGKESSGAGEPSRPSASKTYEWKMVTTWPKNFPVLGTGANQLAQNLEQISGGRLKVRVYGAGELVPALGCFDAVSRGTAQMAHGSAYYWKGKHEALQFFSAVPFGLNAHEMNGWLAHGGGQQLWDELYSGFGLKGFAAGNTLVQMGGWFNKEIRSPADFSGLKMRMPGLGGEVLNRLGAAVVNVPGGEIFQALTRGTIDACEWVGPYNDQAFGFHKAAKYYYWPGWHEPGTTLECMVNLEAYQSLPADLQAAVRAACAMANDGMMAEFAARNAQALAQLTGAQGVQLRQYSTETLDALGGHARAVLEEMAARDSVTRKVHASFSEFFARAIVYGRISEQGYAAARARVFG